MTIVRNMHGRLNRAGHVVTYPRQVILYVLGHQDGPFTADELVRAVERQNPKVGRATVFRLLAVLEGLGLIERLHDVADCHRYFVCVESAPHHHLVCVACGKVGTIVGRGPEAWIQVAADEAGFRPEGHVVQIFGRCRRCRAAPPGDFLPAENEYH